ncbi:TIGR01777 family oxidoreductase [Bacillus sp. FJAT-29790]|uniref:TIGR01777 family oxidoreductase n=1 Tax=Bacillus sp. FJAT-29790 TaxID=1895002 RepID=UPI001C20FB68|nr:TIGR01777 family oxidoreductase [Bacillus sp. FJAT-29790]MBU8880591.1 TIGR01777 family oxidoreductase [Bacillus sp. FJAT-29790]
MKIAVTGGTGFVGRSLTNELINKGHEVLVLTRNIKNKTNSKQLSYVQWLNEDDKPEETLEGIDVLINLAGESINSGRWTDERKGIILDSRISATREVLRIFKNLNKKPDTFINASAVGFYGTSVTKTYTEESIEAGLDYLAKTVQKWEIEAHKAQEIGIRTVLCRFGIILDKNNGALPRIALPYKLFTGGTVGTGNQWVSWIHLKDVIKGIMFAIKEELVEGPVNFTAPNPVTMREFGQTLGEVLHRPHWMPAPAFALKAALGEMSILVLEGQKVIPGKLVSNGYPFLFEDIRSALKDIY